MKCRRDRIFLFFDEHTEDELSEVEEILTWEDKHSKEKETLLFYTPEGEPYTFWGFFDIINAEVLFDMEITNQRKYIFDKVTIDKNILPSDTHLPGGWFKELASFQVNAAEKALMFKYGLNEIPTGGGKTEIILAILRYMINKGIIGPEKRALIIVPSKILAEQFKKRAIKRGFDNSEIGVVHGTLKEWDQFITVAVSNTISSGINNQNGRILDLFRNITALFYDEVHHLRSDSWVAIAMAGQNAEYLLGYSGSATLEDEIMENSGDAMIYGLTGRPIYRISASYLVSIGFCAEPIVFFEKVGGRLAKHPGQWHKLYDQYIVRHGTRNQKIAMWVDRFVKLGFPVMLLVQRLHHADLLMRELSHHKIVSVFGGNKGLSWEGSTLVEQPIEYGAFCDLFEQGAYDVMIGSTTFDEGVDLPSIGMVGMAGAGKSRIKTLQRLGRGGRAKRKGWNRFYILDFDDCTHVYMKSHSKKRRDIYEHQAQATIITDQYKFYNMAVAHSREMNR